MAAERTLLFLKRRPRRPRDSARHGRRASLRSRESVFTCENRLHGDTRKSRRAPRSAGRTLTFALVLPSPVLGQVCPLTGCFRSTNRTIPGHQTRSGSQSRRGGSEPRPRREQSARGAQPGGESGARPCPSALQSPAKPLSTAVSRGRGFLPRGPFVQAGLTARARPASASRAPVCRGGASEKHKEEGSR